MLKESKTQTLPRSDSLTTTNTEMTEDDVSLKKQRQASTTTSRSSSYLQLSEEEVKALSSSLQKEQRSRGILVVRSQQQSLNQSLDQRLKDTPSGATKVSFDKLHIREFARRPGDNPGCRVGVSLTIEWEIQDEQSVDLEAYEESRPPRRDRGELNIPSETRMQMLKESGWARGEILTYVKMTNIARGQRSRTQETLQLAGAQEMAQRFYRGVLNKTVRSSKKKKEKKLLRNSIVLDQKMQLLRTQLTAPDDQERWQPKASSASPKPRQAAAPAEEDDEEASPTPTEDMSDSSYEPEDHVDEQWVPETKAPGDSASSVNMSFEEVDC